MNERVQVDIPLAVVGCDFQTASTAHRETLVTSPERRRDLCRSIRRIDAAAGFLALETCNRVEWIVSGEDPAWLAELLKAQVAAMWEAGLPAGGALPEPTVHTGDEAVRHLLRVVMGLESLATGEAQIAGQFQDALNRAREEETTSIVLNRLGTAAGRLAKVGYRVGYRSNHRRGVHGLVDAYLRRHWETEGAPKRIAVVGMGSIGRKTAQILDEGPQWRVERVNRTVTAAHRDAWHSWDVLPALSREIDALVVATGALEPVVSATDLDLSGRSGALIVMDIGVPRQVAPELQTVREIAYRTIDDLLELPAEAHDPQIASRLDAEIAGEMERFTRFCMERDMAVLLDRIHRGRRRYIYERIPAFIESNLDGIDASTRRNLEKAMKTLIQDYARDVHTALQTALEEYWSRR